VIESRLKMGILISAAGRNTAVSRFQESRPLTRLAVCNPQFNLYIYQKIAPPRCGAFFYLAAATFRLKEILSAPEMHAILEQYWDAAGIEDCEQPAFQLDSRLWLSL